MTNKPDLSKVWAENADPTDIKNPDLDEAGKFQKGWLSEIPPHTWFNYIQNNFSAALAHFNEYGVAQWDTDTAYPIGGWARSTVNGEVYISLIASNQGYEPSGSPAQWTQLNNFIIASKSEAEVGTNNNNGMTPLRVHEAFGQFGLGQDLLIQGSLDLNTITDTSIKLGSGLVNAPAGVSTAIVFTMYTTNGGGRSFQLVFPVLSGDMHIRSNNGGVWGAWNEIQHDGNTPRTTARGKFDGTGVPSIDDGFNFGSITDNGTGDYTINFSTPLANADYSVVATSDAKETAALSYTVNGFRIQTSNSDGVALDRPEISFIVVGGKS